MVAPQRAHGLGKNAETRKVLEQHLTSRPTLRLASSHGNDGRRGRTEGLRSRAEEDLSAQRRRTQLNTTARICPAARSSDVHGLPRRADSRVGGSLLPPHGLSAMLETQQPRGGTDIALQRSSTRRRARQSHMRCNPSKRCQRMPKRVTGKQLAYKAERTDITCRTG